MTIQKAFVERNRLKKYIALLSEKLRYVSTYSEEDETRDWRELDGVSYDEVVDKILEAKNALGALNCAIDVANVNVRPLLDSIETTKAQLSTVSQIVLGIRGIPKNQKSWECDQNDKKILVEHKYKADINVEKYVQLEKDLNKTIRDLEDQISEKNAETQVEISKELKEFLLSYNA